MPSLSEFIEGIRHYRNIIVFGTYLPIDHLVISLANQLSNIPGFEEKVKHHSVYIPTDASDDTLYIIFCSQHFSSIPAHYVCVQVEQYSSHWLRDANYQQILSRAKFVIDYSKENIENIGKFACFADKNHFVHIPFLYDPALVISPTSSVQAPMLIKSEIDKPIDVLFIGHITERRANIVRSLSNQKSASGDSLVVVAKTLVSEDEWIYLASRSKIFLNIHSFEGPHIIETSRLIRCLANNCFVVSEDSTTPSEDECMKQFPSIVIVKSGDRDALDSSITKYLGDSTLRDSLVAESNEKLKTYTLNNLLKSELNNPGTS